MSLFHALLIGLIYYLANTSFLCGLAYFTTWRPVVNGFLVGLALGEPAQGALVGALINVLYLGYLSVGGTLGIGDAALAGITGATASIMLAVPPAMATGVGVVVGVLLGNLGFPLLTLRLKLDGRLVRRMDAAAEQGNARAVTWLNIAPAQALLFAITAPAAAALALMIGALGPLAGLLPDALTRGLSIAGMGLSGALGIALAMRFVFQRWGIAFFLAGFALAGVSGSLSLIADISVAVLLCVTAGSLIAILAGTARLRRDARHSRRLPLTPFWLWQCFSHSAYSFERLQGSGFAGALAPLIERVCATLEDRKDALKRQLAFFNTEVNLGAMLVSIVARMEAERAAGRATATEIEKTKSTLMGALAGFGDPLIQGALLPCVLSTALVILFSEFAANPREPALTGLVLYVAAIGSLIFAVGWLCYQAGDAFGRDAVTQLLGSPIVVRGAEAARGITAFMLGALVTSPWVVSLPPGPPPGGPLEFVRLGASLLLTLALWGLSWRIYSRPMLLWIGLLACGVLMALNGVI